MPAWEAAQLALGLAIPPLLAFHIVGTRLAHTLYGVTDSYARTVLSLWHLNPSAGARQTLVLLVAWARDGSAFGAGPADPERPRSARELPDVPAEPAGPAGRAGPAPPAVPGRGCRIVPVSMS